MAQETEIKLSLPQSAHRALLRHPLLAAAQSLGTSRLVNVYYDTADLALQRKGIALRTRKVGRLWLQTVKCAGSSAAGLAVRPEWEYPFAGAFDFGGIDDPGVRTLLERQHLRAHLEPAFETVFTRRTWRIAGRRGGTVLLMLDRGRIDAGGRSVPISEIEIELERGAAGALFDVALALAATLPLRPEILSKAERGFRLRLDLPPQPAKAAPSPLDPAQTPLQAFGAIATACLTQLQLNALGAGAAEPEFIHQMRVALRRLRCALRVFRPVLPDRFEATVVPHFRALARALGAARDLDVLAGQILAPALAAVARHPHLAALEATVARAQRRARADAWRQIAAPAHALALLDFGRRLQHLKARRPAEPLDAFAARRLGRLRKRVRALAAAAGDLDPARLHALRIGVKRLRYAIEFFAPLYPPARVRKAANAMAALQDALGELNDLARAGELFAGCADGGPDLREAVALTGGWHGPRHAALCAALPRELARLTKMRPFWNN